MPPSTSHFPDWVTLLFGTGFLAALGRLILDSIAARRAAIEARDMKLAVIKEVATKISTDEELQKIRAAINSGNIAGYDEDDLRDFPAALEGLGIALKFNPSLQRDIYEHFGTDILKCYETKGMWEIKKGPNAGPDPTYWQFFIYLAKQMEEEKGRHDRPLQVSRHRRPI